MQSRNIFLLLLLVVNISLTSTSEYHQQQHVVCSTVEVRSHKELDKLTNCTIVIGNVAVMIGYDGSTDDNLTSEYINSRRYPLREITGFAFFHTIKYLNSLGSMFPNLRIIRGQRLFSNYALVVYDTELKEMTLPNLLRISRGSVRIGGYNEHLCLPKIDWDSIIQTGILIVGKNVTKSNCTSTPKCAKCPKAGFCWNNGTCQKFTQSSHSVIVKNETKPCHSLCLGECIDETSKGCFVCKDLSQDFECVEACSMGRLLNTDSRRCITPEECINVNRKIYEKECLQECPSGYSAELSSDGVCKFCQNSCPKICSYAHEIKTISQLEAIGTGCTIINSSLEINIIDDIKHLTTELQTYLGNIEEIHGSLKIYRSNSLTTLTFLNKLNIVAKSLKSTETNAIRIFENQNLQKIWDRRSNKKLTIVQGSVLIYNNFRLCENEVANFKKLIEGNESRDKDYMLNNGNKKKCLNSEIKTQFGSVTHDKVEISWTDASVKNISNLDDFPGYLIQYVAVDDFERREVDENMLYERDICSSYGWKNALVKQEDVRVVNQSYRFTLHNLTQYTTYAYTIQLYYYETAEAMNDDYTQLSNRGASEAQLFKTNLVQPSRVTKFSTTLKTTDSITLQFDVLPNEKNAIDEFLIYVYEQKYDINFTDQRNYCKNPIESQESVIYEMASEYIQMSHHYDDYENCCDKCCDEKKEKKREREIEDDNFQSDLSKFADSKVRKNSRDHRIKMQNLAGYKNKFAVNGTSRTTTVSKLKPFTFYMFHIYACTKESICSEYEMHSDRTARNEKYDRVTLRPVANNVKDQMLVHFEEPNLRNGVIVSYLVELREFKDNSSHLAHSECITRKNHEFNGFRYSINKLNEGNYSFRVKAVSLAGNNGQFSDFYYFSIVIPPKEISWNWIIIGISSLIIFLVSASISYYYKHKIITILKRQGDSVVLMNDVQPTDFYDVSLKHTSCDRLSDIMENEEY